MKVELRKLCFLTHYLIKPEFQGPGSLISTKKFRLNFIGGGYITQGLQIVPVVVVVVIYFFRYSFPNAQMIFCFLVSGHGCMHQRELLPWPNS